MLLKAEIALNAFRAKRIELLGKCSGNCPTGFTLALVSVTPVNEGPCPWNWEVGRGLRQKAPPLFPPEDLASSVREAHVKR